MQREYYIHGFVKHAHNFDVERTLYIFILLGLKIYSDHVPFGAAFLPKMIIPMVTRF